MPSAQATASNRRPQDEACGALMPRRIAVASSGQFCAEPRAFPGTAASQAQTPGSGRVNCATAAAPPDRRPAAQRQAAHPDARTSR
jgi:hypothetical protein